MKVISTVYPEIGEGMVIVIRHGGEGSGFSKEAGHKGRPGEVGGSSSSEGELVNISDIDDKEIEEKIKKICSKTNFSYDKIYMSKKISTVLGEYKTETDYIVLSPNAMGESLEGVLVHEIAHAQSADILKEYFNQRQTGGGDIFKALSGRVSDVVGDDGYFTEYVTHFSKNFEEVPTIQNRFFLVSEGYAESRRMEYEGKEYPQSWKDLHDTIMGLK